MIVLIRYWLCNRSLKWCIDLWPQTQLVWADQVSNCFWRQRKKSGNNEESFYWCEFRREEKQKWLPLLIQTSWRVHLCFCCSVSPTHSLLHSFTHSLLYSFTHSLIHSFTHLLLYSFTPSLLHFFTPSLLHSFTPPLKSENLKENLCTAIVYNPWVL